MNMLLATALTDIPSWVWGLLVLEFAAVVAFLGAAKIVRGAMRSAVGVRDTTDVEIKGQPIRVQRETEYLTVKQHAQECAHMERRVAALESRANTIEKKMDDDKQAIIKAGEERATAINARIDDLASQVAAAPAKTVALLNDAMGITGRTRQ